MRISRNLLPAALASGLLLGVPALGMMQAGAGVLGSGSPLATPAVPMITSTGPNLYVSGMATNDVGTPGQFTFSDPGSTVSGYYYGLFGASPSVFVPAAPTAPRRWRSPRTARRTWCSTSRPPTAPAAAR